MAETTNKEVYQPMTFDAIKIGLASSDQAKTGIVIVVKIKRSVIKGLSATAVV